MKWFILSTFDYFKKHRLVFWLAMLACFALLAVLSLRLKFEEDITKMLQMDEKTREYNNIVQNTKLADKIAVSISFTDTSKINEELFINFADSLASQLESKRGTLIKKITLRTDDLPFTHIYSALLRNLPMFLEPKDYLAFDSLIEKKAIVEHLEGSLKMLSSPAGIVLKRTLTYDPIGISNPVTSRLRNFGNASDYELYNNYFFSKGHKRLVFFIEPANPASETGKNKELINILNQSVSNIKCKAEFKDVSCKYIGATAIAVGNAQQIQRDTLLTLIILIISIIVIITLIFKKKRTPVLIFLPVIFGLLFALAMVVFVKPTISLIAIGASSVLLGIAVNYPIHLLTHYLHVKNLRQVISDMVVPMTIGSATTIGGFLCLLFVKSEILHDLGLLGAFSLVGAALFSLIFLPHLMGEAKTKTKSNIAEKGLERFSKFKPENAKIPILIIFIVTPILLYFCQFVSFDSDLAHLNYMKPELKLAEKEMKNNSGYNYSLYVISYGKNTDEALDASLKVQHVADSLKLQHINTSYVGVATFVPSASLQQARYARWKEYWTDEKIKKVTQNLKLAAREVGFTDKAFTDFIKAIQSPQSSINDNDYQLLLNTFGGDAITQNKDITTIVSILKIPSDKTDKISPIISGLSGNTLLDPKFLATSLLTTINNDFNFIAIFCALLVFFALLFTYGRIELALTAFIPMLVSWIWILGLMGLFGIQFNVVNIILSTFIFGLGDDYCIFIMDGLLQEYKTGEKHLPVIKISIVLSGLTTLIGFGVLLIAQHPALKSIATVSVIGILSVLFISQTLEPWLFKIFVKNPVKEKHAPISALTVFKSVLVYSFFVFGSLALTVIGFILVTLNFFAKEKGRYLFRAIISRFMWMQMYMMPSVKKRIINLTANTFDEPSVIICNHQSVIDILMVGMLSPKIITLTNKWVWNSPVFGFVVRNAGYYPVINGIEETIEPLRQKVGHGFSIAIFPEGTRSKDREIGRFHKGAFHVASELNLDITPIILHSTGNCIQKGSMILRDTVVSLKILPRIKHDDVRFGLTVQERTKAISKYYKAEYAKFAVECETSDYFKKKLIDSYIFKGPVLEWYLRVKISMEKNYRNFESLVPRQGIIVDAGCGYGFLSHILAFTSQQRTVIGIDYDESKIAVARHTYSKPTNLSFDMANVTEYAYPNADCFIFSDVLHYLTPDSVIQMLSQCLAKLNAGGKIIIRDGDTRKANHDKTQRSELFSTRIFRFNKTENELQFFPIEKLIKWAEENGLLIEIIEKYNFASNIILVLKKQNG